MLSEMGISSLVGSRHYLLFKVVFAEKQTYKSYYNMYFHSVLLKGKEGDQIYEDKILSESNSSVKTAV